MQITTNHSNIGYNDNVTIIERALRERFGISDASGMITVLAQHIWSQVCIHNQGSSCIEWGDKELENAIESMRCRMDKIEAEYVAA